MRVQVAIDCADPHRLAAFYAAAFGYEVERHCSDPVGALPRLLFQHVPEEKGVKNRVHLDFQMGGDAARDQAVDHLLALGATRLWDGQQGPVHKWVTIADPEGNELCVSD